MQEGFNKEPYNALRVLVTLRSYDHVNSSLVKWHYFERGLETGPLRVDLHTVCHGKITFDPPISLGLLSTCLLRRIFTFLLQFYSTTLISQWHIWSWWHSSTMLSPHQKTSRPLSLQCCIHGTKGANSRITHQTRGMFGSPLSLRYQG